MRAHAPTRAHAVKERREPMCPTGHAFEKARFFSIFSLLQYCESPLHV
jgi:hypothetical protein